MTFICKSFFGDVPEFGDSGLEAWCKKSSFRFCPLLFKPQRMHYSDPHSFVSELGHSAKRPRRKQETKRDGPETTHSSIANSRRNHPAFSGSVPVLRFRFHFRCLSVRSRRRIRRESPGSSPRRNRSLRGRFEPFHLCWCVLFSN